MTPAQSGLQSSSAGPFLGRNFLPPAALLTLLGAIDRLASHWKPSGELGLLGRGGTWQVRPTDLAVQAQLDVIRGVIAVPALRWARACGFQFGDAPFLSLFPVRMLGNAQTPAYQEPHRDSHDGQPHPPVCSNVFYAMARAVRGGDLAVASGAGEDLSNPAMVSPSVNTIVTIPGDRVHWVAPLYAGERVSVVINVF